METKQGFYVGDWVKLDGKRPAVVRAVGGGQALIELSGAGLMEEVDMGRLSLVFKH